MCQTDMTKTIWSCNNRRQHHIKEEVPAAEALQIRDLISQHHFCEASLFSPPLSVATTVIICQHFHPNCCTLFNSLISAVTTAAPSKEKKNPPQSGLFPSRRRLNSNNMCRAFNLLFFGRWDWRAFAVGNRWENGMESAEWIGVNGVSPRGHKGNGWELKSLDNVSEDWKQQSVPSNPFCEKCLKD